MTNQVWQRENPLASIPCPVSSCLMSFLPAYLNNTTRSRVRQTQLLLLHIITHLVLASQFTHIDTPTPDSHTCMHMYVCVATSCSLCPPYCCGSCASSHCSSTTTSSNSTSGSRRTDRSCRPCAVWRSGTGDLDCLAAGAAVGPRRRCCCRCSCSTMKYCCEYVREYCGFQTDYAVRRIFRTCSTTFRNFCCTRRQWGSGLGNALAPSDGQ